MSRRSSDSYQPLNGSAFGSEYNYDSESSEGTLIGDIISEGDQPNQEEQFGSTVQDFQENRALQGNRRFQSSQGYQGAWNGNANLGSSTCTQASQSNFGIEEFLAQSDPREFFWIGAKASGHKDLGDRGRVKGTNHGKKRSKHPSHREDRGGDMGGSMKDPKNKKEAGKKGDRGKKVTGSGSRT